MANSSLARCSPRRNGLQVMQEARAIRLGDKLNQRTANQGVATGAQQLGADEDLDVV
jgi:hypothetical protein